MCVRARVCCGKRRRNINALQTRDHTCQRAAVARTTGTNGRGCTEEQLCEVAGDNAWTHPIRQTVPRRENDTTPD
jgi:hypothetical protein